jgi:hypothetical protein
MAKLPTIVWMASSSEVVTSSTRAIRPSLVGTPAAYWTRAASL